MGTIWCPYTNTEIDETKANSEHIIPLSLGGVNGFEISVDAITNSTIGSELDGALANDFLTALQRADYDARGHSGAVPMATVRNATYGDDSRRAQVRFHKHGVAVWDVRDREYKKGTHVISVKIPVNLDLPVRFTAKVALAAGYYVYGDLFRTHVDHRQLRDVMRTDPAKLDLSKGPVELGLDHLTLRVDNYMHKAPSGYDSTLALIRLFCSSMRGSSVVLVPSEDHLIVGVGILGRYLATVDVPARTASFPKMGNHDLGHLVAISNKRITHRSWRYGIEKLAEVMGANLEIVETDKGQRQ